ncbi:MAG: hypothetical protein JWL73_2999 [Actinomycetia bacterium]|nr:hypothetical protein [Actinomycetes bacterium]
MPELRTLSLSFVQADVLIVLAAFFITSGHGSRTSVEVWLGVIVLVGIAALVTVAALRRRPIVGETPDAVRGEYRQLFFLKVAASNCVELVGFFATVVTATPWLTLVAAVFTFAGLAMSAPTRADVTRHGPELLPALLEAP